MNDSELIVERLRACGISVQLELPIFSRREPAYRHMGGLIADCALQAGVRYETVVWPRVRRIVSIYPEACTTTGFETVLDVFGPREVLRWRHPEKVARTLGLVRLFRSAGVDTVEELAGWIDSDTSRARLRAVHGIGPKTVDYVALLSGKEAVAVDRHLYSFAAAAGVERSDYDSVSAAIHGAACLLNVGSAVLDKLIWEHERTRRTTRARGMA